MRRISDRLWMVGAFLTLGTMLVVSTVWAQEKKADAAAAPKAANEPSAAEQFAEKLGEWKALLKELRSLQADFGTADEAQGQEIRKKFAEIIARGEGMVAELRSAGIKAYEAAPQEDLQLERFLISMLYDDINRDNYEPAAVLAKALLDSGCDIGEVYDQAGLAAFATNDYETVEARLKKAEEEGKLSDKGREFLDLLPEYKGYWEAEQKIREKEAQDDDLPRVKISTSKGDMVVELFENQAPDTVGNFVSLVEAGKYDGLKFHRVLPQFMAQGGCPIGDGTGGPGYNIYCECYKDDYRKHFRGTLSMAHSGKDTGGMQFFITFVPTPHLNGMHTAFGRVIEGMDVLARITRIDPDSTEQKPEPDKIVKMEVLRKRDHEYKPNKAE